MRGLLVKNKFIFNLFKKGILYTRFLKSILVTTKPKNYDKVRIHKIIDINDKSHHCFFGYYDRRIFSENDDFIIFQKVPLKKYNSHKSKIIILNLKTNVEKVVSETLAWNWQQGSMLQWLNNSNEEIIFNGYKDDIGYVTFKYNLITEETETYNLPTYCLHAQNDKFLSLNFQRLQKLAIGYGYPITDTLIDLTEDGVWECDIKTNKSSMLFSLSDILCFLELENAKSDSCYINHLEYIPNSDDFIFIFRTLNKDGLFYSRLFKYDAKESRLVLLIDTTGHVSHFCWFSDIVLFIYATNDVGVKSFYYLDVLTGEMNNYEGDSMTEDGHPSFTRDKKFIINDTYPNTKRIQFLYLYDNEFNKRISVDELYSPFRYFDENRCDLHPRWNNKSNSVAIDTTHTGKRTIRIYQIFN